MMIKRVDKMKQTPMYYFFKLKLGSNATYTSGGHSLFCFWRATSYNGSVFVCLFCHRKRWLFAKHYYSLNTTDQVKNCND